MPPKPHCALSHEHPQASFSSWLLNHLKNSMHKNSIPNPFSTKQVLARRHPCIAINTQEGTSPDNQHKTKKRPHDLDKPPYSLQFIWKTPKFPDLWWNVSSFGTHQGLSWSTVPTTTSSRCSFQGRVWKLALFTYSSLNKEFGRWKWHYL